MTTTIVGKTPVELERERICEVFRDWVPDVSVTRAEVRAMRYLASSFEDAGFPDLAAAIREGVAAADLETSKPAAVADAPCKDEEHPTISPGAEEGFTEEELGFVREAREYCESFTGVAEFYERKALREDGDVAERCKRLARAARFLAEQEERRVANHPVESITEVREAGEPVPFDDLGDGWVGLRKDLAPQPYPPADDLAALKGRIGWDAERGRKLLAVYEVLMRDGRVTVDVDPDGVAVFEWWNNLQSSHPEIAIKECSSEIALIRRLVAHDAETKGGE